MSQTKTEIEVSGQTLTVIRNDDHCKICDSRNEGDLLFTVAAVEGHDRIKKFAEFYLRGRRRGQAEGRNEVRA